MSRMYSHFFGWVVRPICKVDNRGAYNGTTSWHGVDCVNCLKKMENKNGKS